MVNFLIAAGFAARIPASAKAMLVFHVEIEKPPTKTPTIFAETNERPRTPPNAISRLSNCFQVICKYLRTLLNVQLEASEAFELTA